MMPLSLDHDVSEKKCEMRQKIIQKIIIMRAPHTPKCLDAVVPAHPDRALSLLWPRPRLNHLIFRLKYSSAAARAQYGV